MKIMIRKCKPSSWYSSSKMIGKTYQVIAEDTLKYKIKKGSSYEYIGKEDCDVI